MKTEAEIRAEIARREAAEAMREAAAQIFDLEVARLRQQIEANNEDTKRIYGEAREWSEANKLCRDGIWRAESAAAQIRALPLPFTPAIPLTDEQATYERQRSQAYTARNAEVAARSNSKREPQP